ncbi:excalibur calcium-binding domain-containing protein [Paenibacillus albiflavus]|uniref:Excalibur calcium-binding domain-containing protein n=1 Tax=Paenibacillus albiflavus TaxID=2545760 RepID=A0A4R4E6V1_9BACL|nr:excalibur calcium-binding domain-containing protein [Paenibacillus albiflavus]
MANRVHYYLLWLCSNAYYKNCAAVRAAGATPINKGDPVYRKALDRDGDGIGCE